MKKHFFLFLLALVVCAAGAQNKGKKPVEPSKPTKSESETVARPPVDTILGFAMYDGMTAFEAVEYQLAPESSVDPVTNKTTYFKDVKRKNDSIRRVFRADYKKRNMTFYVRTRRPFKKGDKMKMCINIVNKDTNLLYTVTDSICVDPEFSKVMYQKQVADSVYMLIYVSAFSKAGGGCNGDKESKLYFVRWQPVVNRAVWKTKIINSCAKTITNMTKTPIEEWDGKSQLVVEYHRGPNFLEIMFDPEHPELGLQNTKGSTKGE